MSVCLSVCPSFLPSICLSVCGSTALVDFGRFLSFIICTQFVGLPGRGISPSQGNCVHRRNSHPSMPRVGLEPTILVFERAKTVHAAATVIVRDRFAFRISIHKSPHQSFDSLLSYRSASRVALCRVVSSHGPHCLLAPVQTLVP
jgi:hypothetical protein